MMEEIRNYRRRRESLDRAGRGGVVVALSVRITGRNSANRLRTTVSIRRDYCILRVTGALKMARNVLPHLLMSRFVCLLGPFYGAIAVPSVTRCRCCRCRCRRHRCAGGVRQ